MRGLEERLDVEDERGKGGANNEVLIARKVLDGNEEFARVSWFGEEKMSSVCRVESLSRWWAILGQMAARLWEGGWFKLSDCMC